MQQRGSLVQLGNSSSNMSVHGEMLNVVLINDPPFTYIDRDEQGNMSYRGYLVDLWQMVAERLDLSYRLLPQPPGDFGTLLPNGTWTGMVGECAHKRADVALSWLMYTRERAAVLDFVDMVPVVHGDYDFYVRSGKRQTPRLTADMFFSLLRPLHTNVWLILLLSLLMLAVVLTVTVRLSTPGSETDVTRREFHFGSSLLRVWMTVTGQGWDDLPNSMPARVVTISSWVMGILISVNYTANLISYVTVSQQEAPIRSLTEFHGATDWIFATERGIGMVDEWEKSSDPAERDLARRMVSGDRFLALDGSPENVRRAISHKTLLYFNLAMAFTLVREEACYLQPLADNPPIGVNKPNYMVLRKGLGTLKQAINTVMQQLLQAGVLRRVKLRWFGAGRQQCSDEAVFRPLSLADLLAVLVIVPLAAVGCCLLLAAELLSRWLARRDSRLPGPGPYPGLRPATKARRHGESAWSASSAEFSRLKKAAHPRHHLLRYE